MILFEDVSKEYYLSRSRSIVALKNINIKIDKGEFVAIIGPSGSGKSTFLALASLLDKQTSGEVYLAGNKISNIKDKERTKLRFKLCSFIFQFASLTPALPVIDNVMLPLLLMGEKREAIEEKAKQLLMDVGIKKEYINHLPYQLSGGEQRRVAVARALIKQPQILFADEPTSALDEGTAQEIIQYFHQLHQQGTTIIMVTHDKQLAREGTTLVKITDGMIDNNKA
ncbi:ABC transporter ATP-binding protein [Anaerobacillus sp. CMMVII]|uniref:ABC transporter ATP-binding protein n=1 Tax=Anaerobacillus sp. CMMVII TaxID=2755588 RepID=UPI0021B7BD99|nr:ABC transporter ATP-binding protein [Anaerobacillus sp. CMMVII]MCT8137508.1 ABC transporter ATP-binding protein [Anaerobacillus sp. CMMVII]